MFKVKISLVIYAIFLALFFILLISNRMLTYKLDKCKQAHTVRTIKIDDFNAIQAQLLKDVDDENLSDHIDGNTTVIRL
jgi:hypothetical protein